MKGRGAWLLVLVALVAGGTWWWSRGGEIEVADASAAHAKASAPVDRRRAARRHRLDRDLLGESRATIRGVVHDPDGEPIAGATVCAQTFAEELSSSLTRKPACATSGPKGHYAIEGLFAVTYSVAASAPRFRPTRWENPDAPRARRAEIRLQAGQTTEGIDLLLKPGGVAVRGVVKDLAGGPIAGAWVNVQGQRWFRASASSMALSDDEGAFEAWVAPGKVSLRATADGYTQTMESGIAPGQTFELYLTPASTLVGKVVVHGTNEPVAGARVVASGSGIFGRRDAAISDENGEFRIEGIEPGTYKAKASTAELFGMAAEAVHLGLAETSVPIVVEVHPAFAVEGSVVVADTEGEPCPSGWARLENSDDGEKASSQIEPDGSVVFRALQPGSYQVHISCDDHLSQELYPPVEIVDASVRGVTWEVSRGLAIRGVVVHADGAPVQGASVSARPKLGDDPRAHQSRGWGGESEADGTFEVAGLLPGRYELMAYSADLPSPETNPEVELQEGRDLEDVRIEIPATGTIEGIVRDEHGDPVGGVSVRASGEGRGRASTTTTDDGRFRLEHVVVGVVRVSAQSRGWQRMRAPGQTDDDIPGERVTVEAGEVAQIELVVEGRDGVIRGQVLDADGGPVSDAFVDVERESDSAAAAGGRARQRLGWGSWWRDPILTDVDGRFELDELAEGRYTLRAYRQGGGEGVLEHVETGTEVTVTLGSPGVLEGTVSIDGGGAPERFTVSARDDETGQHAADTFFRTDGIWRLTNVSPGSYEISIKSADGDAQTEVELAEGETRSGIELVLTRRVTVRGTVFDVETGEPVAGMKVQIGGRTGGIGFSSATTAEKKEITDGEGRFEVKGAPVGPARAAVVPRDFVGGDYGWTWVAISVPAGQDEVELPPIEVVKKRVEDGKATGSLGLKLQDAPAGQEAEDRRLIVAFVRPGGPAATAGIEVGDEIVEVDGHDVRGANGYLFGQLTRAPPGHELSLRLADGRDADIVLGPPQ